MPMPKPNKEESKEEFLDRCMDSDLMNDEYPDNKQRYAICNQIWDDKESKGVIMDWNTRSLPTNVEWRVDKKDDGSSTISGHAAVFDKLSEPIMDFREKISKGAFAKTIKKDDIRALWNHNPDYVLGRNKSGTLRLKEDDIGLAIEIDPPDTQWVNDLVLIPIERGDVDQMSFGFTTVKDQWEEDKEKKELTRTLLIVDLFDVSPVTYPAYPQTDVEIKSFLESRAKGLTERIERIIGLGKPDTEFDNWQEQLELLHRRLEMLKI